MAGHYIERELKKSRHIVCTYNHYYMDTVRSINERFEAIKKGACPYGHPPDYDSRGQMTGLCNGGGHALVIKPPVAGEPDDFLPDNDAQALQDMQVREMSMLLASIVDCSSGMLQSVSQTRMEDIDTILRSYVNLLTRALALLLACFAVDDQAHVSSGTRLM